MLTTQNTSVSDAMKHSHPKSTKKKRLILWGVYILTVMILFMWSVTKMEGLFQQSHQTSYLKFFHNPDYSNAQFPVKTTEDKIRYLIARESMDRQVTERDLWSAIGNLEDKLVDLRAVANPITPDK